MTNEIELPSCRQRALRFLHVPKTAGTSVNVFLDRIYPVSAMWVFNDALSFEENLSRLRSLDPERRRSIKLFRGHAPFVTGEPDVDGARTFTLLRDPVQRVMSYCCHVAEGKSPDLRDLYPPETFTLKQFLDSGDVELQDLQTKMLLGKSLYEDLLRAPREEAFREALASAFDRLELVGVQERYEDTMIAAMHIFGWPRINPRKRLNVRSADNPVSFSEDDIARITAMNRWDALAHRMARERFAEAWRRIALRAFLLKQGFALQRAARSIWATASPPIPGRKE